MHNDRLKWTWAWRLITTRVKRYVAGTLKNQKSFSAWNELESWGYKPGNVLDGTQDQSQYRRNLKKNKKMMDDLALMYNEMIWIWRTFLSRYLWKSLCQNNWTNSLRSPSCSPRSEIDKQKEIGHTRTSPKIYQSHNPMGSWIGRKEVPAYIKIWLEDNKERGLQVLNYLDCLAISFLL